MLLTDRYLLRSEPSQFDIMEKRKKKKGWISCSYRPVMHMILPDIKEEEQYELENVASVKTHEKSSSLPTSKDYAGYYTYILGLKLHRII